MSSNDDNKKTNDSTSNSNNNKNNISSNNNNYISLKRSTFNKIIVVGIAALMFASFFGGYTFRASFYPNTAASVIQAAGTLGQQPTLAGAGGAGVQQQP